MVIKRHTMEWLSTRVNYSKELFATHPFDVIFKSGGYIAGGFLRKLFRSALDTPKAMVNYIFAGGDIDVFFKDYNDFMRCVSALGGTWCDSPLKNAICRTMFNTALGISAPIQLVRCRFCSPEEMLATFDFTNCMIATDGEFVWVDDEFESVERYSFLDVVSVSSTLPQRMLKYITKRECQTLTPRSRQAIAQWVTGLHENAYSNMFGFTKQFGVRQLTMIDDPAIDNEIFIGLLGRATKSYRFPRDGYHALAVTSQRFEVDVAQVVLNRRQHNTEPLFAGDLVQIEQSSMIGTSAVLVLRASSDSVQVLLPDGPCVISTDVVRRVLSRL